MPPGYRPRLADRVLMIRNDHEERRARSKMVNVVALLEMMAGARQ